MPLGSPFDEMIQLAVVQLLQQQEEGREPDQRVALLEDGLTQQAQVEMNGLQAKLNTIQGQTSAEQADLKKVQSTMGAIAPP